MEQDFSFEQPEEASEEQVAGQLASFAFIREDREREVRLLFRDVSAAELAVSFRRSGATLITLMGERAAPPRSAASPPTTPAEEEAGVATRQRKRRKQAASTEEQAPAAGELPGELTVRYFYGVGEMVYTVSIAFTHGVAQSIAPIYPNAALREREMQNRIGAIFVNIGS